jgi:hypothetical protein
MSHYGDVDRVIKDSGVTPTDLRLDSSTDLRALIEEWLSDISAIIDADRHRSFADEEDEGIKRLVDNVANRMGVNMVGVTLQRMGTSTVSIDDLSVRMVEDGIFTAPIRRQLGLIARQRPPFRIWRVRGRSESDG